jgi:LmbE family N-acetylglucosaminyl deacetylase
MTADRFPEVRAADDLADTSRFVVIPVPDEAGLASQVRLVVEQATGRRWFAKAATAEFDAANEVICARLAQALALARPQAAFVADPADLVLIQHVADHPNDGELLAAGVDIAGEPSLFGPDEAALGSPRTWPTRPASPASCCLRSWSTTTMAAMTGTGW